MSSGGGSSPKPPKAPSPAPTPKMSAMTEEVKKKVKRPRTGRESTILAGRMMLENDNPYNLKSILG